MEGNMCTTCWQGTLQLQQGALVCDACGSFFAGYIEEAQEYQGGTQTHFHRRTVRTNTQERTFAERETPQLAGAILAYLGCLQRLLQRQAVTLQSALGVNPLVARILERLWLEFVPHTGILDPEFASRLEARIKPPTDAQEQREEVTVAARMPSFVLGECLTKALPPSTTLSLCLLACWHLREAVGPMDIVRWALSGQLPYLRLVADATPALEQFAGVLPLHFLDPRSVPAPVRVWDDAVVVASSIGLPSPPINVGLWLHRWTRELALPEAVAVVGLQLYELYRLDCPQYHLQYRVVAPAPTHAMALLVVAVKLLYGLDGQSRETPSFVLPPPDWLHWARVVMGGGQGCSGLVLSLAESMDMSDKALQRYLSHVGSHAFPGAAVPEGLEEHRRWLLQLAEAHAAGQQGHERRRQQQQQQGNGAGAVGQGRTAGSRGAASGDVPAWQRLFEEAWRPQRGSGEDPALLPACSYPFFGRAFGLGAGQADWLLPLDYVAVLAACAAQLGVVPNVLHTVVSELEADMIRAEVEVAYAADEEAQSQLQVLQQLSTQAKLHRAAYEGALQRLRREQPDLLPGFTEAFKIVVEGQKEQQRQAKEQRASVGPSLGRGRSRGAGRGAGRGRGRGRGRVGAGSQAAEGSVEATT